MTKGDITLCSSVKSSIDVAEIVTSEMHNALDALQKASQKKIEEAEETTLEVNEQAITANHQVIKLSEDFVQTFEKGIERIMSLAEKFEEQDKQMYKGGVR